jgi:5-amino-6-(5-phosphoribosylamino)uracil reductase
MSIDGFIDDASSRRLLLSNERDFDLADQERSLCDAILVGAGTIRADDPSLLVKSEARQRNRESKGLPRHPLKVTLTRSGNLPDRCKFLVAGESKKLIYCHRDHLDDLHSKITEFPDAQAITLNDLSLEDVLTDLYSRGVRRLLVEGGNQIATSFLTNDLVDELHVSIAPFFVGEANAPRFVNPGTFPYRANRPMRLNKVEALDGVILLKYSLRNRVIE